MSNPFDKMKSALFDLTTGTFGYTAIWSGMTGKVHFRHPNENESLTTGIVYSPTDFFMEYRVGLFPGLYDAIRSDKSSSIIIQVENTSYVAMSVRSVYDGDTYQVHLTTA